jgi:hypothetical protein
MRYQISDSEFGGNLAGKSGAPARNRTGICHLGNGRSIHLSYGSNKSAAKITEFTKAYKFGSVCLGIRIGRFFVANFPNFNALNNPFTFTKPFVFFWPHFDSLHREPFQRIAQRL